MWRKLARREIFGKKPGTSVNIYRLVLKHSEWMSYSVHTHLISIPSLHQVHEARKMCSSIHPTTMVIQSASPRTAIRHLSLTCFVP